jgi:putative tryptophan/tyrosine transport system substrate-binding protein
MNRRDIVVCLLWSAALLGRVHAQQTGKVYHIAIIAPKPSEMSERGHDQAEARVWAAFFDELRRLGYVEGKNLVVKRYSSEGRVDQFRDLASGVVRRNPDLIYTIGPDMLLAFKAASTAIPAIRLPLVLFPACPDRAAISRVPPSMLDRTFGANVSNY